MIRIAEMMQVSSKRRVRVARLAVGLRRRACVVAFACLLLLDVNATAAAPLADYRTRVHQALVALDTLVLLSDEGDATEGDNNEAGVLEDVRRSLPAREQIEWTGGALEADNAWLHAELDAYEKMNTVRATERVRALKHITERLGALEQRLAEVQEPPPAAARRDKDAEKGRLASILRRPDYNQGQSKNENALTRLWQQIKKWISQLFPRSAPLQPGASPGLSRAAQLFIYGLCLAVIALLLWKYGVPFLRRGWPERIAPRRREPRVVLGEELSPEQTASDLLIDAERLARAGDVRGAIRKAYVALLCELGDRNVIRLAQHKTNRDYLGDVRRERATLYREMQPLTLNFERHWYGLEAATEEDWTNFRTRCRQAINAA